MKVRMLVGISGGRGDNTPWPGPGDTLTVDDAEGRHLIQARLAVAVEEPAERAVIPDADVEERAAPALPKRAPRKQ